jgi:hypothetical protein
LLEQLFHPESFQFISLVYDSTLNILSCPQRNSPNFHRTLQSQGQSLSPTHEREAFAYVQNPASVSWQSGVETKVSTPLEVNWRKIDSSKNPRKEFMEGTRRFAEDRNSKSQALSQTFQALKTREVAASNLYSAKLV